MITRTRVVLLAVAAHLLCAVPAHAQSGRSTLDALTPAELRYALSDSVFGWASYRSDGTARGDTTRRLAAAAMWDMEGGDQQRGVLLVQAALDRGVSDSLFYGDAREAMTLMRCPRETLTLFAEARRRWPGTAWADSGYARAARRLQASSPADQRRTCPVRARQTTPAP